MKHLLIALVLLTATPASAFSARVVSFHEGETCRDAAGQGVIKVRLAEIDPPEIDQPYGTEARDVLCAIVCSRCVEIEPRGASYDRLVGLVRAQGVDTSEAMVTAETAWDYPQYDTDPIIPVLEAKARAGHVGLWAAALPIAPWDWRHSRAGHFRSR